MWKPLYMECDDTPSNCLYSFLFHKSYSRKAIVRNLQDNQSLYVFYSWLLSEHWFAHCVVMMTCMLISNYIIHYLIPNYSAKQPWNNNTFLLLSSYWTANFCFQFVLQLGKPSAMTVHHSPETTWRDHLASPLSPVQNQLCQSFRHTWNRPLDLNWFSRVFHSPWRKTGTSTA